jgi:outer membrane protein assembly factor BamB
VARHRSRPVTALRLGILVLCASALCGLPPATAASKTKALLPKQLWAVSVKKGKRLGRGLYQSGRPILHNGILYVGSAAGGVHAISTEGKTIWRFATRGPVYAPVTIQESRLYAADGEGVVYALDLATGTEVWHTEIGIEMMAQPLVVKDRLFVVTMRGQLVAIQRADGVPLWHTLERLVVAPFTVRGASDPILQQGNIVVGYADGRLAAHNPRNGQVVWEERIAPRNAILHDVDTTPAPYGSGVIVSSIGGGIAAVDTRGGRLQWFERIGSPNTVVVTGNDLIVAGRGSVARLSAKSGALQWNTPLPQESEGSMPAVANGKALIFSTHGGHHLLDVTSGAILGHKKGGAGTHGQPTVDGDRVYIVLNTHRLVAYQIP